MTDPTPAELVRRLEDAVSAIRDLTAKVEQGYVRKDLYEARHEGLRREIQADVKDVRDDIAEIKADRKQNADRWKQAMFAVGIQLVLMLIVGAVAVSNFMARSAGGG